MEIDIEQLPQTVAELVDTVGLDAALRLVEAWGGVRVYVPQGMPDGHALHDALGADAARQLAARCGGDAITVPRCAHALRAVRNSRIRRERAAGASPAQLALRHQLTERQIYSILASDDEATDERQQALPL